MLWKNFPNKMAVIYVKWKKYYYRPIVAYPRGFALCYKNHKNSKDEKSHTYTSLTQMVFPKEYFSRRRIVFLTLAHSQHPVSTAQHKVHCKEISTYVFLKKELRGLSPNFRIHVSVSDLYIPRIGSLFFCIRIGRLIAEINKSHTGTWM